MTDEAITVTGEWSNPDLDPVSIALITKILESNNNLMYTVHEIANMNTRILAALVKEPEEDTPEMIDEDSL